MRIRLLAVAAAAAGLACSGADPSVSSLTSALEGELPLASYDPALGAPSCSTVESGCASGTLLAGRGDMAGGAELNAPNTVDGCPDAAGGVYLQNPSVEAIRVTSEDGTPFAAGKAVRVDVDVFIGGGATTVHVFTAPAPAGPWTYRGRQPAGPGLATATWQYFLADAPVQVVRAAVAAYGPSTDACLSNRVTDTDSDDLAFAVAALPPDVTPPTVAVTSPVAGAQVNGTVELQAAASDDRAVTRLEWLLDGALLGTDSASPWTLAWDTLTTTVGAHTLSARALDAAGNVTVSDPVAVEVIATPDVTPPTNQVTAPRRASYVGGTVMVTGTASDANSGVVRVEWGIGAPYGGCDALGTALAWQEFAVPERVVQYAFPWDTTQLADARHQFDVYVAAYDAAGNRDCQEQWVIIDNVPDVAITEPVDGTAIKGTVTISASAGNANGIARVEFFVDGALIGTSTTAPYSVAWSTKKVPPGAHVLAARAVDVLGFTGTSLPVTVTTR